MSAPEYNHDSGDYKVQSTLESIQMYLDNSKGTPDMSTEDIKASLVLIKIALAAQRDQLNNLANFVFAPKKTFIQKLLNK
jgi:hypothetical protein